MFGLFKKETEKEKLQKKYKQLLEEAYKLSSTNRKASDAKQAEADQLIKKIESLP
ncbi:MAG: Lacal_2735 family protein [Cyclobacteriaceae bacterium]